MAYIKKTFLILGFIFSVASFASQPQKLKSQVYKVCGTKVNLEIAQTDSERNMGLMHRTEVPAGTGMLFVFPQPQVLYFWMRNVPMDIDIGYFDSQGKLVHSITMKGTSPLMVEDTLPRYSSEKSAQFAVEVAAGFYSSKNTKTCVLSPLPKLSKNLPKN